jgi:hypothetical protein
MPADTCLNYPMGIGNPPSGEGNASWGVDKVGVGGALDSELSKHCLCPRT